MQLKLLPRIYWRFTVPSGLY